MANPQFSRNLLPILAILCAALYMVVGDGPVYLGYFCCPGALLLVHALIPSLRVSATEWLSPKGMINAIYFLTSVFVPLIIKVYGMAYSVLPSLPSDEYIEFAFVLKALAFLTLAVAWHWSYSGVLRRLGASRLRRPPTPNGSTAGVVLALACISVGLIGFLLNLDDIKRLIDAARYANNVGWSRNTEVRIAIGNLLRPYAGVGLMLLWCKQVNSAVLKGRATLLLPLAALGFSILTAVSILGTGRGDLLMPFVTYVAVYSATVKSVPLWRLLCLALLLLFCGIELGQYRETALSGAFSDSVASSSVSDTLSATLQVYGAGPQFLGFGLQEFKQSGTILMGTGLVSSLLSPIPIIGKVFRDHSGFVLYNAMIYGADSSVMDQIIPFGLELWINGGIIGFLIGYLGLGCGVACVQAYYVSSGRGNAFSTFVTFTIGYWLASLYMGSFGVVSQYFIYKGVPIVSCLLVLSWIRKPLPGSKSSHGGALTRLNGRPGAGPKLASSI